MANKKKKTIVDESIDVIVKQEVKPPENCNHQNKHAQGELFCILSKGHEGDHFNGSYWSDAAGIPVRKHA